ncbi:MAG: RidA family protein [Bacteroidales bacterium]
MSKKVIASPLAPAAVGPYSQAIEGNGTLYVSGMLPIDSKTGEFVKGGITEQAEQIFKNLKYVLDEAGYAFSDVVKSTVYLSTMNDFGALNTVYAKYFSAPYPARVCYAVASLPKASLVEIELIATK